MNNIPARCLQRKLLIVAGLLAAMLWSGMSQAFLLKDLNEEQVNLLDYVGDGRWTVIMLWSTDCIPCEEQKPAFEEFHQQHKDTVASSLGVVIDGLVNAAEVDRIMEKHDPSYPNLVAYSDVFHRQYQELIGKPFRTTPTYLIYNPGGNLQGTIFGYMDFVALSQHVRAQN